MVNKIIGRNEYVSIPKLNFFNIKAKIDTGAYSCSIHCSEIHLNADGTVQFNLLDNSHEDYTDKKIVVPISNIKKVKSSNGTIEERIFIELEIEIFGKLYLTELSLTDRKDMKLPMLLGRKFLKKRFIVDVSLKYQTLNKE